MKIEEISEKEIKFNNGTTITFIHDQDCCENVYADFKQLMDTGVMNREFEKIEIVGVPDKGFRLNNFFVPCYNEQNGYYGSDLELKISYSDGKSERIPLGKYINDVIG